MRHVFISCLCALLISSPAFSRSAKARSRPTDPVYSSALAAANRFLQAWQAQDHETGIMMLSDSARQHSSPELLDAFFSRPQAAYEIGQGRRLKEGYAFPVVLFASTTSKPHRCVLLVTRSGKSDWVIDRVP